MVSDRVSKSAAKQIRNLLFVLFSAIAAASLLTVFTVYYYGPTGRYLAKNVLLDPAIIEKLSYNDINPNTGGVTRFAFENMEFSYYDAKERKVKRMSIGLDKYRKFYDAVGSEKSEEVVNDDILDLFNKGNPSKLTLMVRTENNSKSEPVSKVFQQVHFAIDGDFYRVELHEQNAIGRWAYFHHPKIYNEVIKIFIPQP